MQQGYIDSQGNKYILTGVKAQFPRWTYAEWQAEGEPDIPWIWTDAPSGYRKVSGDDVSYDNTNSVNDKIDDSLKDDLFTVTYNQDVESVVHKSHYINSNVVHIFEIIKIKNSFSGNHTLLTFSKTAAAQGMTIVLFQGNSQWGVYSNIKYGFLGPTSIVTNESLTANQYVLIDTITVVS